MWSLKVLLLTLTLTVSFSEGARILSVTFMASKSFRNAFDPLFFELADRGHNLTLISPIEPTKSHPNIREINLPPKEDNPLSKSPFSNFFERRREKEVTNIVYAGPQIAEACHSFLKLKAVQELITEEFDLIIGMALGNECSFGYIYQFNTNLILLSPITPYFALTSWLGAPSPRSFVPSIFTGYSDNMGFFERMDNFLAVTWYTLYFSWRYLPLMDSINREYFGPETPSSVDIVKNTSLVLVNSHLAVNYPRPLMPDMIDVGGSYCRPAKPLPKEIEDFIGSESNGDHGFIYFSMGSVLQGSTMPPDFREAFVKVFRKLPVKVLWKWETEDMPDRPDNVKLLKWAPQQDILGHKNIRLFITHAGGLSTSEAIYHGVPMISIPMFGDQDYNSRMAVNKKYGIKLELGSITEATLSAAINEMLNNPSYSETAIRLSNVFRDRITDPLETAVYWVEYVLRHGGAPHLRSPARDLNFLQYYCLDVILVLLALFSVIAFVGCVILARVIGIVTGKSRNRQSHKKIN